MTRVQLPFTPPFDAAAALGSLRAHAIPGVEVVEADSVTRIIHEASRPLIVAVTLRSDAVTAEISRVDGLETSADELESCAGTVRRWFDLNSDPTAVTAVLGPDAVIGPLRRQRPGLRVIGSAHPFETAIMTVLGQQVSLARARTFGARAVATYGVPTVSGMTLFPTPEALAAADGEELRRTIGLTGARARTVQALAAACASGLDLAQSDDRKFRDALLAIPGIGPWTADYLAVRVLGDRDAFTASDLVLRRALGGISARDAEAASAAWRPWRAYALFHLWTSTAY